MYLLKRKNIHVLFSGQTNKNKILTLVMNKYKHIFFAGERLRSFMIETSELMDKLYPLTKRCIEYYSNLNG